MKKRYDFSKSVKNPHFRQLTKQLVKTMRAAHHRFIVLAIACCAALAPLHSAQPQDAYNRDALALAQAMQMEMVVKEAFQMVIERNIKTGRATQAELDCVKQADFPFAIDVYAAGFARVLTLGELKEALTFFSKPTGKWFLKFSRDAQAQGLTAAVPEDMTEEQSVDLAAFMGSTAWRKLLERREYETPELKQALFEKVAPIILECKNQAMRKPDSQR